MSDRITRETVLDYIAANPGDTSKRDIARGMKVRGEERRHLREILNTLENEGILTKVGKRAFAHSDTPPPTGVVQFETIDENGDLFGRANGKEGPFGPAILYMGPRGRRRKADPGVGDRALCQIEEGRDGVWRARMIKRLQERAPGMIGVYTASPVGKGGTVSSASRKDKRELVIFGEDVNGAEDGQLVRCDEKPSRGHGPRRGVITEILGHEDDARAASILAMAAHEIRDAFPESVIREAETAQAVECQREDLTGIPLITIDPEDARDHDDAVCAMPDEDPKNKDGWRVWVAIADVSAFVQQGSQLDREAYARSNSTYFPDRVAPMLPEALSTDECSLREKEMRTCMAVEMTFDAAGKKLRHRFTRGMMRSAAKLSYQEAQDAIDGKPNDKAGPLLEPILKPLWAAWKAVDGARKERDPLELDLPERKVSINEDGKVDGIKLRERFDAHKLIEEFMIQANVCAAETLEDKRSPLIYRVHPVPSDEKILALATFLDTLDLKWTKAERVTPSRFNKLLDIAREGDNADVISEMILRSQAQAIYTPDNEGHFGLNLLRYAHFTSPIRRYADLIVHRALIRALNLGPDGLRDEEAVQLEEIASHLVERERASMAAERDASDRYLALFLEDKEGAEFEGRVSGVTKFGLFVRLNETSADGFVPASKIGNDEYWRFADGEAALVADISRKRYELGMPVTVRLKEATPLTGGLLFEMLTPPRPPRKGDKSKGRPAHKSARRKPDRRPGKRKPRKHR